MACEKSINQSDYARYANCIRCKCTYISPTFYYDNYVETQRSWKKGSNGTIPIKPQSNKYTICTLSENINNIGMSCWNRTKSEVFLAFLLFHSEYKYIHIYNEQISFLSCILQPTFKTLVVKIQTTITIVQLVMAFVRSTKWSTSPLVTLSAEAYLWAAIVYQENNERKYKL